MQDEDQPNSTEPLATLGHADAAITEPDASAPPRVLWLIYLFLRPRSFFRHFVVEPAPGLTALCAWFYGMAGVIGQFELDVFQGEAPTGDDSLLLLWAFIAGLGAVAGVGYFIIGGWWYRVRLKWSGAQSPDSRLARRVYLFAAQIVALPAIVRTALATHRYAAGGEAPASDAPVWYALFLFFCIWSSWNSYVGVRTAFDVRRGRALTWFFILPGALYAFFLAGALSVAWTLPNVNYPATHDSKRMTFSYPGNWRIDTRTPDYDPNGNLHIAGFPDVGVQIRIHESNRSTDEQLTAAMEWYRDEYQHVRRAGAFDTWGGFTGQGWTLTGESYGYPYSLRLFVTPITERQHLQTREWCAVQDEPDVTPGFELIRSTFKLKR